MFRLVSAVSILYILKASAQPLSCKEDAHCCEGYYCDTKSNMCLKCLQCEDLKRDPPKLNIFNVCVKSISSCGPCSKGFISIYKNDIQGKCVKPEFFKFGRGSYYAYVGLTAAVVGLLIMATFVYVIRRPDLFRIVVYFNQMSASSSCNQASLKTAMTS